jgi:hypothetical protein
MDNISTGYSPPPSPSDALVTAVVAAEQKLSAGGDEGDTRKTTWFPA